jgi:hypothetical protein
MVDTLKRFGLRRELPIGAFESHAKEGLRNG